MRHSDILKAEYDATLQDWSNSSTRMWQSLSVLIAVFVGGGLILKDVVPSEDFPDWLKVSAVWIFLGVLLLGHGFWTAIMAREGFYQYSGHVRMVEIELALGMRRQTRTLLLLNWSEREKESRMGEVWREVWQLLPREERRSLEVQAEDGIFRPLRWPKLRTIGATVAVALIPLMVASASLTTVYILVV